MSDSPGDEFVIDLSALDLDESVRRLIAAEKDEFAAVLGRPVAFRRAEATDSAWVIEHPDAAHGAPSLRWDSPTRLVSVAATPAEFLDTMNALHTLAWQGTSAVTVAPAASVIEATDRIRDEIANTYPYFALRGLDWDAICARHDGPPVNAGDFADFAAAWVAELGDAHTAIKTVDSGGFNPPYRGALQADGVRLTHVPSGTAAWDAGVRPGWVVAIDDVEHWRRTVGATPQQLDQVQARRALAFRGESREFLARGPEGEARWVEHAKPTTQGDIVQVGRDATGKRTVRIHAFNPRADLHSVLDDVFAGASSTDHLTVDLRGNTGGSIVLATDARDRFLRERTRTGSVAFTDGRGGLSPRRDRWAEPSERSRWPGTLEILIDAMTYSASEDFVLGLQGLEHVTVRGTPSGRPVEFRGIRPDRAL